MHTIGCFISSHGFGHATRTCAILDALARKTAISAHLFTAVNESVFSHSLAPFYHHPQITDVGFVQHDAFHIDIKSTLDGLTQLLPFETQNVTDLAHQCRRFSFILCDISALGIAVAEHAGIPSVLVENFTWDWLYTPYVERYPKLGVYCSYLKNHYERADYHIQTAPCCSPSKADLHCGPIFRSFKETPDIIRARFNSAGRKIVLITLGGIGFTPAFIDILAKHDNYYFIVTGQQASGPKGENIFLLSSLSDFYHPDLINCSDLVVFKAGYSTLAECYQSGKPTICIGREGFPESSVLESFARQTMHSKIISQADFISGKWLSLLPEIVHSPVIKQVTNGAERVRDFLLKHLLGKG